MCVSGNLCNFSQNIWHVALKALDKANCPRVWKRNFIIDSVLWINKWKSWKNKGNILQTDLFLAQDFGGWFCASSQQSHWFWINTSQGMYFKPKTHPLCLKMKLGSGLCAGLLKCCAAPATVFWAVRYILQQRTGVTWAGTWVSPPAFCPGTRTWFFMPDLPRSESGLQLLSSKIMQHTYLFHVQCLSLKSPFSSAKVTLG